MLGVTDHEPKRLERMLAALLVALFPFSPRGRRPTEDDVADWDHLRHEYLGVDD